jgi:hypothetical protein
MAQPETAAGEVGNPADSNPADAFNAIAEEMLAETQQDDDEAPLDDTDPEGELDETDIEEEADDLPPIDAPVSWDRRSEKKPSRPSHARRKNCAEARGPARTVRQFQGPGSARAPSRSGAGCLLSSLPPIEAQVRAAFQYAEQIAPQRPNPALLGHDPQAFYAMQADYEAKVAQQRELQQQAQTYAQQAQARAMQMEQANHAEQHRAIVENFPEYADPTTGPELQRKLTAVAKELGYPDELISQARASDILAMRTASNWKAKADKYDALQAKKMENVRAAKGLPRVATPGVAQGGDQVRANRAATAFERAKSTNNREAKGAAFYEFLANSGHIKK